MKKLSEKLKKISEVVYLEDLVREAKILEAKAEGTLANNLCPDHRDKQTNKKCLACRVEELEKFVGELVDELVWKEIPITERSIRSRLFYLRQRAKRLSRRYGC